MNPMKNANCCVLGDGENSADHAHVKKGTPMQLKKQEYANDPMYQTKAESDLNRKREKATTAARRGGNVRPLDGGVAN